MISKSDAPDSMTIVSRLTSIGPAAIAVLEIRGKNAMEWIHQCWQPNQSNAHLEINRIRYGFTRSKKYAHGESIVVCRIGDDCVELHCHGGKLAADEIIKMLVDLGAVEQSFENRLASTVTDDFQREATEDLTKALTHRATAILLDQMRGALSRDLSLIQSLIDSHKYEEALSRLKVLESRCEIGCHLIEPWQVVMAGPPNSGKSSLLNLLLGYTRAIVHEQAGTTRDILAERSSLDGWPIELVDGAGVRTPNDANDIIEAMGIERTLKCIANADCILLLVDQLTGWTDTHQQILDSCTGKVILVKTKMDLSSAWPMSLPTDTMGQFAAIVETSSVTEIGLKSLMGSVVDTLVPVSLKPNDAIPFRKRHREWIQSQLILVESSGDYSVPSV